eukprot:COSAG01_NODE_20496_length_950_cov_1.574618_2_plen_222_part_01
MQRRGGLRSRLYHPRLTRRMVLLGWSTWLRHSQAAMRAGRARMECHQRLQGRACGLVGPGACLKKPSLVLGLRLVISREAAAAAAAELAYVARRLVLLVWQCWGEYTRHRRATRRADALHHRAARARGLRSMRRAVHASQLMGQVRGLIIDAPCPLFASHGASIRQVPSAALCILCSLVCVLHTRHHANTYKPRHGGSPLTPQLVRQRKRAAAAHRRQRTSE